MFSADIFIQTSVPKLKMYSFKLKQFWLSHSSALDANPDNSDKSGEGVAKYSIESKIILKNIRQAV